MKWFFIFLAVVALLLSFLYVRTPYKEVSVATIEEARDHYKRGCIMCHGPYGQGNGSTAKGFPVRPPDWTNPNWLRSVTDEGIRMAILKGGKYIGRSDFMPMHPEYENTDLIEGFVALVREFGRR